jgi:hypothetical protein
MIRGQCAKGTAAAIGRHGFVIGFVIGVVIGVAIDNAEPATMRRSSGRRTV